MNPISQDQPRPMPEGPNLAEVDAEISRARSIVSAIMVPLLEMQKAAQNLVDTQIPLLEQEVRDQEQIMELSQQKIQMAQDKIQRHRRVLNVVTDRVRRAETILSVCDSSSSHRRDRLTNMPAAPRTRTWQDASESTQAVEETVSCGTTSGHIFAASDVAASKAPLYLHKFVGSPRPAVIKNQFGIPTG